MTSAIDDRELQTLVGRTIVGVSKVDEVHGSGTDKIALVLDDGRVAKFDVWAFWADDCGLDLTIEPA